MANDYGNVPGQAVYGEVKEIEEQEASAPLVEEAPAAAPAPTEASPVPPEPAEAAPALPSGNNMVEVLPPLSTSPAMTGARPQAPEQQLALLILGTPGMSSITRSFAAQIMGRYRPETNIPDQQLGPEALQSYRQSKVAETLPQAEEEAV